MGRILFWLLLGLVAYFAWRWWQSAQRLRESRDGASSAKQQASRGGEPMVACRTCGLNLPQSEALTFNGRSYCCEEHRRRGSSDD